MKRYTANQFERDLVTLNEKLKSIGDPYRFVFGSRNNYTAVDLATPEQAARHVCQCNLECGSPRDCLNACYKYIATRSSI